MKHEFCIPLQAVGGAVFGDPAEHGGRDPDAPPAADAGAHHSTFPTSSRANCLEVLQTVTTSSHVCRATCLALRCKLNFLPAACCYSFYLCPVLSSIQSGRLNPRC